LSERAFKVRVKIGDNEVEISGNQAEVMNTLGNVSEIVRKVAEAFGEVQTHSDSPAPTERSQENISVRIEEFPSLSLDPGIVCPEAIVKLLATDWGRKQPRALGELLEAMKVNAIHYPEGTVKGRLTDLTKRGALRRIKAERGYGYILVKP